MTFIPYVTDGAEPGLHERLLETAMALSDRDERSAAIIFTCQEALSAGIPDTALFERTLALATGYMPYWRQGGFVGVMKGRVCACGPKTNQVDYFDNVGDATIQVNRWVERG